MAYERDTRQRPPNQAAPINLFEDFYLPRAPCEGRPFLGPQDRAALVYRGIHAPAFCQAYSARGWMGG